MADQEVWGFKIQRSPSGKKIWPNELKREATRRLREADTSPGEVAAEIGAHECLVRKWWVADRRSRGEKIAVEGPAFAQVAISAPADPSEQPTVPSSDTGDSSAHLYVGAICIKFPLHVAEPDLLKLIRVARECQ